MNGRMSKEEHIAELAESTVATMAEIGLFVSLFCVIEKLLPPLKKSQLKKSIMQPLTASVIEEGSNFYIKFWSNRSMYIVISRSLNP